MSLKPGWYRIRIVSIEKPDPGPGGMYITLGPHGKVTVEAAGPDNYEAQRWLVSAVNGGTHVYTIEKIVVNPPAGLREEDDAAKVVPVIFGPHPQEWRISHVVDKVYSISPKKDVPIGVEYLVGTEDTNVVVKIFPILPRGDRPAWDFEPEPIDNEA